MHRKLIPSPDLDKSADTQVVYIYIYILVYYWHISHTNLPAYFANAQSSVNAM